MEPKVDKIDRSTGLPGNSVLCGANLLPPFPGIIKLSLGRSTPVKQLNSQPGKYRVVIGCEIMLAKVPSHF